jgi:subfamily B ATP-binding cassette protein MsbA
VRKAIDQAKQAPVTGNWLIDAFSQSFNSIPPNHRLAVISVTILGSVLIRNLLFFSNQVLFSWLNAHIGHRLRCGIFEQLLSVSYRFIERSEAGKLLSTLTYKSWRTTDALSILVRAIIITCTLVVYTALLLLISWKLTLLVIGAIWVISGIVRVLTRSTERQGTQVTQSNTKLADRMIEGMEGMHVIREFGREQYEQERFERASHEVSRALFKLGTINGAVSPIYEVLAAALLVSILFTTLTGPAHLPIVLVFIFILYRLQPMVKELDTSRVSLLSLASAVKETMALLDRSDKTYLVSGVQPFCKLNKGIHFDQVMFRYDPSDKPALEDISVLIPAGKTTALVGPSGAGKSTLIKLILRFYDPTKGDIYVDDCNSRDLSLIAWRSRIATVSQDIYVFDTTVRENITYGSPEATEAKIIAAAKFAGAHNFICRLPQGYSTRIGRRGIRLSGGERQRLALARAIIRNPDILILDEATNALDSVSEHLIQQALETLSQDRTVIVIAHRLSTIERADHIAFPI